MNHVPKRIVSSRLLELLPYPFYLQQYNNLPNLQYVKELVITDPDATFSERDLFGYLSLERISLPNGHHIYEERDGILYKDQGATLAFIPREHPSLLSGTFQIPEGVHRLERGLFKNNTHLKQLEMPDSVCEIGEELFYNCSSLEYVRLSDSLTCIPGYEQGIYGYTIEGTFSECRNLSQVHLPESLITIGKGAFENSGICKLECPEGLKVIDNHAFHGCKNLSEVFLPKSLQKIGYALIGCEKDLWIHAYEGTAKGLLNSIHYRNKKATVWFLALSPEGTQKTIFPLPYCKTKDAFDLLKEVWDGDQLCLNALYKSIPYCETVLNRNELILNALCHLDKEAFQPYASYKRISYVDYGIMLIKRGWQEDFYHYLELTKPTKTVRKTLLDFCNEGNYTKFIPMLLDASNTAAQGKTSPYQDKRQFSL